MSRHHRWRAAYYITSSWAI